MDWPHEDATIRTMAACQAFAFEMDMTNDQFQLAK